MTAVPFTDQELRRAWRELSETSKPTNPEVRKNPHRLLLFYAIECGLKAVWLKRQNRTVFESTDIGNMGHNLHKLLKDLRVSKDLSLPENLQLETLKRPQSTPRNGDISILHQAWRYGGKCTTPTDEACEEQLEQLLKWIQGELK